MSELLELPHGVLKKDSTDSHALVLGGDGYAVQVGHGASQIDREVDPETQGDG